MFSAKFLRMAVQIRDLIFYDLTVIHMPKFPPPFRRRNYMNWPSGNVCRVYFVAVSSFFIIEKMKSAERRQRVMRSTQMPHRGSLSQSSPGIDTR